MRVSVATLAAVLALTAAPRPAWAADFLALQQFPNGCGNAGYPPLPLAPSGQCVQLPSGTNVQGNCNSSVSRLLAACGPSVNVMSVPTQCVAANSSLALVNTSLVCASYSESMVVSMRLIRSPVASCNSLSSNFVKPAHPFPLFTCISRFNASTGAPLGSFYVTLDMSINAMSFSSWLLTPGCGNNFSLPPDEATSIYFRSHVGGCANTLYDIPVFTSIIGGPTTGEFLANLTVYGEVPFPTFSPTTFAPTLAPQGVNIGVVVVFVAGALFICLIGCLLCRRRRRRAAQQRPVPDGPLADPPASAVFSEPEEREGGQQVVVV